MAKEKNAIVEDINFILSHFTGQEYLFPRSIMTIKTKGQVFVDNFAQLYDHFLGANFKDCRVNAYPYHHSAERKNLYPSFIFIDLDLSLCSTCVYPIRKLDYILKKTLLKIFKEIGGYPTVLWTGGGYHIYQPIKIVTKDGKKQPLETIKELKNLNPFVRNDLTTEFIRFAAKQFTDRKVDPKHNPSIYSCLIRIPGTINSKNNEKVKVIQNWNGIEAIANPLILPFVDHLKQLQFEFQKFQQNEDRCIFGEANNRINWIEKLLETPIPDHRYYCLWHILIPYLVTIKGLPEHNVISILTEWLDKCNKLNKIKWKYPRRIKEQLRYDKGYPPISLANLKKENIHLYNLLHS
ncbi:MAG TPA: DNA primase noncatalytic subunit PriX [Candidatus Nitrosocosmicus sp.]|nr:DNA primase noncatalytic subunit PriX [Candidatus Nitrosocosmicus sp.]